MYLLHNIWSRKQPQLEKQHSSVSEQLDMQGGTIPRTLTTWGSSMQSTKMDWNPISLTTTFDDQDLSLFESVKVNGVFLGFIVLMSYNIHTY